MSSLQEKDDLMIPPKKPLLYCFLVSNESRDYDLLAPVLRCFEVCGGYQIEFHFAMSYHRIDAQRPDLVVIPNIRGNNLYFEIGAKCARLGIQLFYHESEGNFSPTPAYDYWGYNVFRRPLMPVTFAWNSKIANYLEEKVCIPREQIALTGAPCFDRYHYRSKPNREDFLTQVGHQNKKFIVGYAGWAFGKIYNKEFNDVLVNIGLEKEYGRRWMICQRDLVESLLRHAAESNPDVLFILKKHPRENFESDNRDSPNEMNPLLGLPNVLYLKDEFLIQNLISVSDLWMAFESTSIMEAWLVDCPTLILGTNREIRRSRVMDGSLAIDTTEAMDACMVAMRSGNRDFFEPQNLRMEREEIIKESIGFADGLNGYRAFNAFMEKEQLRCEEGQSISPMQELKLKVKYTVSMAIARWFYNKRIFEKTPKLSKLIWVRKNIHLREVKERYEAERFLIDEFLRTKSDQLSFEFREALNRQPNSSAGVKNK